jgi:eukaryotic-like serine/threonine-protein kinase
MHATNPPPSLPLPFLGVLATAGALGGATLVAGLATVGITVLALGTTLALSLVPAGPGVQTKQAEPVEARATTPTPAATRQAPRPSIPAPQSASPVRHQRPAAQPSATLQPRPAPPTRDQPAPPQISGQAPAPKPATPTSRPDGLVVVRLLSVPDGAAFRVDGEAVGTSPLELSLSPQTHQIEVSRKGAAGTFTVDAATADRFCFGIRGKKVEDSCAW